MQPICYKDSNDLKSSTEVLRKECMAKAYRALYICIEENPDLKENLNLCLVNPKFITPSSLDEILPGIYKFLEKCIDPRINQLLKIYCPSALFSSKSSLNCPNIIFKLETMYNY